MRTWLLAFVCACTPAVPARPALVPPPTATPPPDPARILSPIGPPLTAATRLLDRPAAALALAWTHPLGEHQQPVIVDRRLVLLERWLSDDPEQRYAVLDAATGSVESRGALPMARALCPAEWRGHEPLSAPTRQCDPFALVSFDLARRATRWQTSLADDTMVFGDILGSIRGHTNLVRVDAGTQSIEHARIDETTGMVHNLPALPGLWNSLYPGHTAIVGDTLFLAVTTGEPLAQFARGVAAGLAYFSYPRPNSIQAVSAITGERLWSHVDTEINAITADAAHVVLLRKDRTLVVLDARTGAVVRRRLATAKCLHPSFLAGDLLFGNACDELQDATMIDLQTGRVRWSDPRAGWPLTDDVILLRDPDIYLAHPVSLTSGEPVWGAPWLPPDVRAFEVAGARMLIGTIGTTLTALQLEADPIAPQQATIHGALFVDDAPWPHARVLIGDTAATTDPRGEFTTTIPLGALAIARLDPRERAAIVRKVGDWAREIEVWSPIFRTADATHRIRLDLARPY